MKHRISFTLLIILCCAFSGFSRQKDSLSVNSYKELNQQYFKFRYTKPEKAKLYANALLEKAISDQNQEKEHLSYIMLASLESYFGNLPEALRLIDKSISFAQKTENNALYIRAVSRKGTIYYEFGKYDDAITYYVKVDSLAEITQHLKYKIFSNQNIGNIKVTLGEHKDAAQLFRKNKTLLEPLKDDPKFTSDYVNTIIGLCAASTYFDLDAAEKYLQELKEVSIATDDKDALSYYFTLKGIVLQLQKKHREALEALQKADSLVTILGRKRSFFPIYRFQGKAQYALGNFMETIQVYEKIKALQKNIGFDHFEYEEVIALLALSYDTIGNTEKAKENFILGIKLRAITDSIEKTVDYNLTKKYDNKTWQRKIDQIEQENKKEKQTSRLLIYVSIGLLIVIIALSMLYTYHKRRNKQKFDVLLKQLQENSIKEPEKPTHLKKVPDEKVAKILAALEKFEASKSYLNQNTSLSSVAKKLNTNTTYLSKTINAYKGLTFVNYITKLRIDYALQALQNDKVLRSYSIKAIAKELGFKSEGAFSRAFKKQSGIYPSYFIKNITADS